MTWSARIEHTPSGLALTFGAPLSRLDMAPDVAQHLASLLAVEARHRMAGVVCALAAENVGNSLRTAAMRWRTSDNSRAPHRAALVNCRQITTCDVTSDQVTVGADRRNAASDSLLPENMPIGVLDGHPNCDDCLNGDHDHG